MPSGRAIDWAKLRIVVVAIPAAAILSVVVYLLTGGTLLTEKVTLYLYIPDASGLDSGSAVRVNGIGVGKVDQVGLSESNQPDRTVRLILKIEQAHLSDIPVDSTAQISSEGVTGDKYVDVTQGRSAARIRPEAEIAYKSAPELLKTLDLQQFAQQLRAADATITDIEQGRGFVGQFVTGTDMYDRTLKAMQDIERSFHEAISVTGSAGHVLRTDDFYRKMSDPLVALDQRLAKIQAGEGQMGVWLRDDRKYTQLRDQAAQLRKSIADLRGQPFFTSDELYVSWTRELGSLAGRVDQINASPMFSNSMTYDNLNGFLHELRTSLHEFQTDPRKFLYFKVF